MRQRLSLLWGGLLLICFLISLGFFLTMGRREANRLFIFPEMQTGRIVSETRRMRNTGRMEERIRAYVEDMVLGPMDLEHSRLLPASTQVNGVLLRGETLYVDFSREFLFLEENEIPLTYEEILPLIKKALEFNFRKIKEAVITIDGREPQKKNKMGKEERRSPPRGAKPQGI